MNTHRPFYAEALQGGLVRLAEDLSSSSPVVNPLPREGSPLSEGELEHQGLRLVLKDGKASFYYRGEELLAEKDFAFDPLRAYVKDKIIDREAPICRVTRQTDTALVLLTRVWVKSGDYTTAQFDLNELIKEALDSVSIPYPAAKLRIEK